MPRLDAFPFESEHQYLATLHRQEFLRIIVDNVGDVSQRKIYVKGLVQAILDRYQQMLDVEGNTQPL